MTLILCHAAKGGVGTTFVAAQLALSIAQRGGQVTAVDFTYQDALKLHFGLLPNQFAPGFAASQSEPLAISDVNLINGFAEKDTEEFLERVRAAGLPVHAGDIVVADVAAADRGLAELLYERADLHLAPLLPDPAALASLTRLAGDTPISSREKTALVLNQLDDRRKLSRHSHHFVRELFEDQLIGTVRRDEAAPEALAMFEQLAKYAPSSVVLPDIEDLTDAVLSRCGIVLAQDQSDMREAG